MRPLYRFELRYYCFTSMATTSGPPLGGFATSSSSSAAVNIPQISGCRGGCTCGCGCIKCPCRALVASIDPNREEYGGEGTLLPFGVNALTQPTSYVSTSSVDSVDESSGAPAPTAITPAGRPANFDTIRDIHGQADAARIAEDKVDRYLNDADECPWKYFVEKSVTSGVRDDDAGFFGPAELDGSMQNNGTLSSNEQFVLATFISSLSQRTPSVGMSEAIRDVGSGLVARGGVEAGHRYLRLN